LCLETHKHMGTTFQGTQISTQFDDEKGKYASMHLEGDAYNLVHVVEEVIHSFSKDTFKNDFFKRFHSITKEDFFATH
jgi:hypothetical protein